MNETSRIERNIAQCRGLLSVAAPLAIYVDPTQPILTTRFVDLSWGAFTIDPRALLILLAHVIYSVAIFAAVQSPRVRLARVVAVSTWGDVLFVAGATGGHPAFGAPLRRVRGAQARRPTAQLSREAERTLLAYQWPGNVRELRNAIERAVIMWPAQIIEPGAFSERIAAHASLVPRLGGDFTLEQVEREHILRVIAKAPTLEEAARILDIESSTLWRKRKRYEETHESA